MSPGELDTILRRLDNQDKEYAAFRAEQRADVKEIKGDVKEVKTEVRKTNGRVTELEKAKAVQEGIAADHQKRSAFRWDWSKIGAGVPVLVIGYLILHLIETGHL